MAKKVKVNLDACIGCGLCVSQMPDVFAFTDDGKSEAVAPVADDAAADDIIGTCPVAAIEVDE